MHTCGLQHHSNRLAAFFAALTGVLYGCTITLAAASYGHGATTMAVLVVRCGFAGGFLSVIYGIMCIRAACGSSRIFDLQDNVDVCDKADSETGGPLGPGPYSYGTRVAAAAGSGLASACELSATAVQDSPPEAASRGGGGRWQVAMWLAGSAVSMATFSLTFFKALDMMPVSECMVIVSTYPLVTLALTGLTEPPHHRPTLTTVALHVLGFGGLILAFMGPSAAGEDQDDGDGSKAATGYLLVAISSVGYALHAFCNVRVMRLNVSLIASAAAVNLGQTAIFAIVYAVAVAGTPGGGEQRWGLPSSDDERGMTYFIPAVILYTPAQLCSFAAFALATNASHVTFFINLDSVTAILLAIIVLGESFAWYQWIGLMILIGALSTSSLLSKSAAGLAKEEEELEKETECAPPSSRVHPRSIRVHPVA